MMGMGSYLVPLSLVLLLIAGGLSLRQQSGTAIRSQTQEGQLLAAQMLMLANGINSWRYHHTLDEGVVSLETLGLPILPDTRIRHVIRDRRLWIWTDDRPGLIQALSAGSNHSALVGIVSRNELVWLPGEHSGLTVPAGINEGDVVYLN